MTAITPAAAAIALLPQPPPMRAFSDGDGDGLRLFAQAVENPTHKAALK